MAKALFLSLPLHGHTNQTLPLVRELVDRGDEVIYYSSDAFARRIALAGATYQPYQNAYLREIKQLPEQFDRLSWLFMKTTAEVLETELVNFRDERPDYILCDSAAPWGRCVGQLLGVPVVTSMSTFAFNRHVLPLVAASGVRPKSFRAVLSEMRYLVKAFALRRTIRRRHGVTGLGMMDLFFGRSDLTVVYTSPEFQPRAETFDGRFHFVGPTIAARGDDLEFPWKSLHHPVLIYVSLGTLFNTDATFFRACFDALGSEGSQVVVSVGSEVAIDALGPIPANCIVRRHVPQLEILRRAAAFLSHGGMNSVSESLYFGVPVVVAPQIGEQGIVGVRVDQLGAGVLLRPRAVTAESIRTSLRRVVAEPAFRSAAARIGDTFRAAGGVRRAADAIMTYTGRGVQSPQSSSPSLA